MRPGAGEGFSDKRLLGFKMGAECSVRQTGIRHYARQSGGRSAVLSKALGRDIDNAPAYAFVVTLLKPTVLRVDAPATPKRLAFFSGSGLMGEE